MSALFLAIPLTIFVLFVLPIWLWLHYSNRSSRGELSQSEQQRLAQLPNRRTKCVNAFRRWKRSWMLNIQTGGIVNVWTESEQKAVANPQQGMVRGVCAGLAHYLDVPVKLVRVVTVLSIFFGLAFITLVAYIVLSFVLDPMPEGELAAEGAPTSSDLLNAVDEQLAAGEKRLREMERYVTSDTFTLRSRFRQL
jgi:phage shock protein C